MHTTFSIKSTSATVRQIPSEEVGENLEPSVIRQVETQYLCLAKIEDVEDFCSEIEDVR